MIKQIRTTLGIMFLLICGAFLWPQQANAQMVYGVTSVEYDATANRLYGYSATETDYYASLYYDSYVEGYIYNENGSTLASGSDLNYPLAEVFTSASTSPGHTYYVISDHYVGAYSYYYDYYYGGYYFYDPFGYSFLGGGNYGSPYGFAPGGAPTYATYQLYYLGSTGVQANLPGVPQINDMVPGSAPSGTSVEVNFSGSNFGTNPTINVGGSGVTVGGISYATETRITAIFNVDNNATTGNHSVSVSAGGYTSNSVNFQVGNRTPQITGVNPSSAAAGDNVAVTISGTGFGTNPSLSVSGGINATVTSVGDQQITANFSIPLSTVPGNYSVRVTSNGVGGNGFISGGGSSPTSNAATFTVTPAPAPRITNMAPTAAPLDTSVEINVQGENFGTNPTLQVGGRGVTVRSYTPVSNPDRQIVAILDIAADAETGNHPVSVATRGLSSNSVNFQVGDRTPQITQITPPRGVRGTTQQVVLTGKGFGSSPTLQVTGTGVNVTINSATDTRIAATFSISSLAEPLSRTVTVTSRGVTGNGFIQSPGTNNSANANYGIDTAKVKINKIDERFAPGAERLNIEYSVTPVTYTAGAAKLEIFKNGDPDNPIFRDSTPGGGTNVPYKQNGTDGWDGKANLGPDAGKFIGPEGSPYTVYITLGSDAAFSTTRKGDPKRFKVEIHSVETDPKNSSEFNIVKPWAPGSVVNELETRVSLKVLLKSKSGAGVLTPIPFKVRWSFIDPDDTSGDKFIDPNGSKGDDNTEVTKGGKMGANTVMWKTAGGFNFSLDAGGQAAATDISTVPGADFGSTKVVFASSVIGGDNYELRAAIENNGVRISKDPVEFKKWSVRKALEFSAAYQMAGGVKLEEYIAEDKIRDAYKGEGYTDYTLSGVIKPYPQPTPPEYLSALAIPKPLTDPNPELPTPQEQSDYANGTPAAKAAARKAITDKAQRWYDRNIVQISQDTRNAVAAVNPTGSTIIGARKYHPKFDGEVGTDHYYPDGIVIFERDFSGNLDNAKPIDPNKEWTQRPQDTGLPSAVAGFEYDEPKVIAGKQVILKISFIFEFKQSPLRKSIVGRHEIGHASDHELFGPSTQTIDSEKDHWIEGLMHYTADQKLPDRPDGSPDFANDSILRLRGRKR